MGRRLHLRRRRSRALGVALAGVAIAACSNVRADAPSSSQPPGSNSPAAVAASDPPDHSAGPTPDATTVAADTGPPGIATSLLDDCVDFVEYGAFIGNSMLTQMWNGAGQNPDYMRAICAATGAADISGLENMSAQWADVQRFTSAATAPPTTAPGDTAETSSSSKTPKDAAVAPPGFDCDPNYTGCVPIASDVDCAGEGDGPAFQSEPVGVIAKDIYDLDPDGNAVGCG